MARAGVRACNEAPVGPWRGCLGGVERGRYFKGDSLLDQHLKEVKSILPMFCMVAQFMGIIAGILSAIGFISASFNLIIFISG